MKAILIEPFDGAAGDMLVCALVDAGADERAVREAMESASGLDVQFKRVKRSAISAMKLEIAGEDRPKRSADEVLSLLRSAPLKKKTMSMAEEVFMLLARAEAAVHGEPMESVHFHEVGQKDAIADIVGVCTAVAELGFPPLYYLPPVPTGWGMVECAHGTFPVPAPAVLEVARLCNMTTCRGTQEGELLTPTGAALLGALASPIDSPVLPMRTLSAGYGAGSREELTSMLRASVVDVETCEHDEVDVLETNVDDATGEELSYLAERLLDEGALDVSLTPALMKKGRMGTIIKVIARKGEGDGLASLIVSEGGSLGVRMSRGMHRVVARRDVREIEVDVDGVLEKVRVKLALKPDGTLSGLKAEYEDVKSIAERRKLPLKKVGRVVEGKAWEVFR